jgi:hypothetical protein
MGRVLVTSADAAFILGISLNLLYWHVHKGNLTPVGTAPRNAPHGRPRNLFDRAEVEAFAATRRAA